MSYINNKWAQTTTLMTRVKAGIILGIFMGIISLSFGLADKLEVN